MILIGSRQVSCRVYKVAGAACRYIFGALIGYLLLRPFMTEAVFGVMFASVAGIMVFISLDELLPAAKEYASGHNAIYGLVGGMAVMALSLLLFM